MVTTRNSGIRKYDPLAVRREHIRPLTFLYGSDKPGIEMRMARFAELMMESGEEPAVLPSAGDAIGYIAAGTMFADSLSVVIGDISDALKSSSAGDKLRRQLLTALKSNIQGSTFVIAAIMPSAAKTKPLEEFISFVEKMGGVARQVNAPMAPQALEWTRNYLDSIGISLPEQTVDAVCRASSGKPELVEKMVFAMGPELPYLSVDEMREWLDADEEIPMEELRAALAAKNLSSLAHMRRGYPDNAIGYRSFLLKLRYAALDLMLASAPGGKEALMTFKSNQFGWDAPVWKIMRLVGDSPSFESAWKVYDAVQDEFDSISGTSRRAASFSRMMVRIAAS